MYYAHTRHQTLALARRKRRYAPYLKREHQRPPNHVNHQNDKENKENKENKGNKTERARPPADIPAKHHAVPNEFADVDNISDLIDILKKREHVSSEKCGQMVRTLRSIRPELENLDAMVGLDDVKLSVLKQLAYYCQGLHVGNEDYMHTVLIGNPGTGKTELAHTLAHMFANIGVLKSSHVHKVTRADLVAGYLGQTAIKTTKAVNEALDGVLFIDEAYSLGSSSSASNSDSYSKECIDTLCELLSLHRGRLLVILAGYEDQLNDCFFRQNQGLRSRFPCWHRLPDYTPAELAQILLRKNQEAGWTWCPDANGQEEKGQNDDNVPADDADGGEARRLRAWFEEHLDEFKNNGRDVENVLTHARFAHSWRTFRSKRAPDGAFARALSVDDMDAGLKQYKSTGRDNDRNGEGATKQNNISREMMYT
jgi:SpoVK/Ycf46/Vps4 family AAA+-type ATPase